MKTGSGDTVKEIMELFDGISVKVKKDGRFDFRMYMTQSMKETSIEALDLSQRSYNCLKRAGYDTVGELTEAIRSGVNLKSVRNCGQKSVREIMERLFLFQYYSLLVEERENYLREVVALNVRRIANKEEREPQYV